MGSGESLKAARRAGKPARHGPALIAPDVARRQRQRINIHLPDALLFDAGQAGLRASAETLLRELGPELAAFEGDIIVEGHTDDLPPGARAKYVTNWELSVARSFSVIHCLTGAGVPAAKLSARGYGEYRPRAVNDNPIGRAANRRIEIVLVNPKKVGKP